MSIVTKVMPASVKALGARRFETIITTSSVDRDRDVIDPAGWKLDNYMRSGSGVILWAHDYTLPPIAKTLSITRTANGLRSIDEFPAEHIYPLADTVHDLVAAGFINAKSAGFIPLKKTWNGKREGWDIHEQELIEHSYVPVPSNPECLVVATSKGLDRARLDHFLRGARRDLDEDIGLAAIPFDRAESERQRRWAAVPRGADVLDIDGEDDVLQHLTPAIVRAALREGVREEMARRLALRAVGRDGLRGDGCRFNARSAEWELW
ncbi:MAG: HK97 family phage prohead protease [Candidatus Rokubacteria bacterium]|nr:HK97 family phage prohead protease [Candidatus Rokubacteria bacterium]